LVSISLCMIVKNEEHAIGRCLDSVKDLVDEIIIVDTGSTDHTREIVSSFTDRIYDFEWIQDFAAARNFSFEKATQDYIFWLDADDHLLEKDRRAFRQLKESLDPQYDAVLMDYALTRDVLDHAQNVTRRHRLVKRERRYKWIYAVHEHMVIRGNVLRTDIEITHEPFTEKKDKARNLAILQKEIEQEGKLSRRHHFYLGIELMGVGRTREAEETFESFLEGETENFEDHLLACGTLAHLYHTTGEKTKELQYLLKTFQYAHPRPDYCCRIGLWFEERKEYALAIFWYEMALLQRPNETFYGLMNKVCWTWGPHVQLAICYGKLGQLDKAYEHNERAMEYYPDDPTLLDNRRKLEAAWKRKSGTDEQENGAS
jgi:glycosyltransferase involved in cell wall biosynthesis